MPGSAFAGTYTWNLASDFTSASPGANPDHDPYGATPWSYVEGSTSSATPSTTFSPLAYFGADDVQGGLSAWSASSGGTSGPLVGINPTGSAIVNGDSRFPPGQIVLEPGSSNVVAVGWKSPFSQTETVSINGAVSADAGSMPPCVYGTSWSVDQNGTPLVGGITSISFSTSAEVAAGGTIYLTVSNTGDAACDATGLSLDIAASGTAPSPSVTSPASGSSSTVDTPTFSGVAGNDFGDSSQVTLRLYPGTKASGTPAQAVTVGRSDAGWSAQLPTPLALGTYTAQAEQDDVVGDAGFSAPVTFTVTVPAISLNSPGSKPFGTSTPTLTGTADADAGSEPFALVAIYDGSSATGSPALRVTTGVGAGGQYSAQLPSLADGVYTAVAGQGDLAGNTGFSAPQSFSVDTHAPAVTLARPGKGSRADLLQLAFTGAAGSAPFDANFVTVSLYRGTKAVGKRIGTLRVKVSGSTWSGTYSGKLRPATYTAVATQTDALGHVGMSAAHTFRVLALPPVIGAVATINRAGRASVKIACNEPAGDNCSGTVLVLTRGQYQPLAGGPVGRLTVIFAYVHIPGGKTSTITRTVLTPVADVLRRHASVAVTISANLRPNKGKVIHATARDNLRRIRS